MEKSGNKTMGTKANLIIAAAAGACTVIVTQVSHTKTMFSLSKGMLVSHEPSRINRPFPNRMLSKINFY